MSSCSTAREGVISRMTCGRYHILCHVYPTQEYWIETDGCLSLPVLQREHYLSYIPEALHLFKGQELHWGLPVLY